MLSSNWESISTLNNMFDFYVEQIFQNIELVKFNFDDHHSSPRLLLLHALLVACLLSSFIDWLEFDIASLHVPSIKIKNKV